MPDEPIQQDLAGAIEHHQAGRLQEAEKGYRHVLLRQPANPDALNLLGVLAAQAGKPEAGAELIRRSIEIRPDDPSAHNNLGIALDGCGRLDEAIASWREAIRL